MQNQESQGPSQQPAAKGEYLAGHVITSDDISELKHNVHGRYKAGANKISLPLIIDKTDGTKECRQFNWGNMDSFFRPVSSVSWDKEHNVVRGKTPNGTKMVGVEDRGLAFTFEGVNEEYHGQIIPMSPQRSQQPRQPFAVMSNNAPINLYQKKNQTLVIKEDVYRRSQEKKKRKPSQNQVMKCTAKEELKHFLQKHKSQLSDDAFQYFTHHKKAEWLHIVAYSLTNVNENPQQMDNLGAAKKRDNTRMMVIEKIPKRLSQYDDVRVEVAGEFNLLPQSDVIKDIAYKVSLEHGFKKLVVYQNIDVFSDYEHPRTTDQLIALVIESLLQGRAQQISPLIDKKKEAVALKSDKKIAPTMANSQEGNSENHSVFFKQPVESSAGDNGRVLSSSMQT
jgi:hypothetical protein